MYCTSSSDSRRPAKCTLLQVKSKLTNRIAISSKHQQSSIVVYLYRIRVYSYPYMMVYTDRMYIRVFIYTCSILVYEYMKLYP